MIAEKLGGRKAVMAGVILAVGVGVSLYKGDIPANLLMLLQTLFGAFVLGNGVEHASMAFGYKDAPAEAETADVGVSIEAANSALAKAAEVESTVGTVADKVEKLQNGMTVLVEYLNKQKAVKVNAAAKNREAIDNIDFD